MVNVKCNFSHRYQDLLCNLCGKDEPQTQEHLLECSQIIDNCPQLYDNRNIRYSDLFDVSVLPSVTIFQSGLDHSRC